MKKKVGTKKRPTDSTLRNVRAANKKIVALAKRLKRLEARVDHMYGCLF